MHVSHWLFNPASAMPQHCKRSRHRLGGWQSGDSDIRNTQLLLLRPFCRLTDHSAPKKTLRLYASCGAAQQHALYWEQPNANVLYPPPQRWRCWHHRASAALPHQVL